MSELHEEFIDIIDDNENIIGNETRVNSHKQGLLHKEVHVWIYNDKDEVLLQKRADDKETFPGLLDISVGGHVGQGMDYEQAALMELEEETGIKAKVKDLIFIDKIHSHAYDKVTNMTNNAIKAFYAYKYDEPEENLRIEEGEATSLKFWPFEKIFNLTSEEKTKFVPTTISGDFLRILEKVRKLSKK